MFSAFIISIFLIISDAVAISIVTGIVSIITLIVQGIINKRVNTISKKQDVIQEQTDGKMNALLAASVGKAAADAAVKGKDELIDVLKQIPALDHTVDPLKSTDTPVDVVVKKNEDKLL